MYSDDPMAALHQRAVDYAPGDTDLSWARMTGWRALVAAAFDSLSGTPKSATVIGAETPPTALLVGWLRSKLGIDVHHTTKGRDIEEVSFELTENGAPTNLTIKRRDERSAVITRNDQADRVMPLAPRDLGDLLAEDVRRLDADEVFAEALSAWTGVKNLNRRSPKREHIWHDPMIGETKADAAEIAQADEKARRAPAKAPAKAAAKPAGEAAGRQAQRLGRGPEVSAAEVIVHRDAGLLAKAVAARIITAPRRRPGLQGQRQPGADRRRHRWRGTSRGAREPGGRGGRLAAPRCLVGR